VKNGIMAAIITAGVRPGNPERESALTAKDAKGAKAERNSRSGGVSLVMGLVGVLFALLYCGLAAAVLYFGYAEPGAWRTAVWLLVFGGLAFNSGAYWQSLIAQSGLQAW
jgi:hypothetical protein